MEQNRFHAKIARFFKGWILFVFCSLLAIPASASSWQEEFAKMPLGQTVPQLNDANCVKVMLPAFRQNPAVKALIFMPGATDEFYFFHRACAHLTNTHPTLLDAVTALTNQTYIRATCRGSFLVLHTAEDPQEPIGTIESQYTADKIKSRKFEKHALFDDKDWDYLQPLLIFRLDLKVTPGRHSHETYHFFRHSFSGYDLTGWEILEAVAMASKTRFTVYSGKVVFQGDSRFLAKPPTPENFLAPLLREPVPKIQR